MKQKNSLKFSSKLIDESLTFKKLYSIIKYNYPSLNGKNNKYLTKADNKILKK